jgi:hypothetical protein
MKATCAFDHTMLIILTTWASLLPSRALRRWNPLVTALPSRHEDDEMRAPVACSVDDFLPSDSHIVLTSPPSIT